VYFLYIGADAQSFAYEQGQLFEYNPGGSWFPATLVNTLNASDIARLQGRSADVPLPATHAMMVRLPTASYRELVSIATA